MKLSRLTDYAVIVLTKPRLPTTSLRRLRACPKI